ncbi:sensor histidine kinase [Roseateles sp. BYS180W]|uniref:histidine kinase n=1 Tax=Roseateles rivi TaxID=3299028 RepID=A0ABW7FVP0_9BURK
MKLLRSLRAQLIVGILLPVVVLIGFNSASLYHQALRAADTAYDRSLLASAKSLGEQLDILTIGGRTRLHAVLPYSALEPFEADNRGRLFYRISGFDGEMVSGYQDLPRWQGRIPDHGPYAALVDFYDGQFRGEPVRMAVLLQPVADESGFGMATIQVAETLELRRAMARQILIETLWRQAMLLGVTALVVVLVVQRAIKPLQRLSEQLRQREAADLSSIGAPDAPQEWQPLVAATNHMVQRLRQAVEHQRRFVRDASHQLKTPLAVLRVQLQSARQGDVDAAQALEEIASTVDRASQVVHQMLALAKVEQLRQTVTALNELPLQRWDEVTRSVALDLAPLIAEKQADFDISTEPLWVRSHVWALQELVRNCLHNALRHTPAHGRLSIRMWSEAGRARLCISDAGPGLTEAQREHLFQPFAAPHPSGGTGLGLTICQDIVLSLQGSIQLHNRTLPSGQVDGLDAHIQLPLAEAPTPTPLPPTTP